MPTRSRSDRWELTQETFERLIRSLHADEDAAVERYQRLHGRLILFFMRHRSYHPEDLADQVINRLASKLAEGLAIANIEAYALGIARLVVREEQARNIQRERCYQELGSNESVAQRTLDEGEISYQSREDLMESQLAELPVAQRIMLERYHEGRGSRRIRERQKLAQDLGLSIGTLRKRIFDLQSLLRIKLTRAASVAEKIKNDEESEYL